MALLRSGVERDSLGVGWLVLDSLGVDWLVLDSFSSSVAMQQTLVLGRCVFGVPESCRALYRCAAPRDRDPRRSSI